MSDLALVMPMAGRGSRFAAMGIDEPKPLINLNGRPFFWWATESVRRAVPLREMVFVVLEEHCKRYSIHKRIEEFYPDAQLVVINDVTSGAAETALLGISALRSNGPVAINDCDHAFICSQLTDAADRLTGSARGALLSFPSNNPAYSYIKLNPAGEIAGTIEKQVVSPYAIAGCYLFSSPSVFTNIIDTYRATCSYNELFISGIFNLLASNGEHLIKLDAQHHLSFGTPEELTNINTSVFQNFFSAWKDSQK